MESLAMGGETFDTPSSIVDAFQNCFNSVYVSNPPSSPSHTPSSINGKEIAVTVELESSRYKPS